MSTEHFVLGIMTVLVLAQQVLWAKIVFNLTNRLMSRNYYEYEQAQALKSPKAPKLQPVEEPDLEAERQAREINSLMGVF